MAANVMFDQLGRQRKERVFRERRDPMEEMPDEEIRRRYRFGKDGITYILRQIQEKLEPKTKRSHCISAVLQLLIALRFLATGSFHQVVGDTVGVDKATVCRIVRRVCLALVELMPQYCQWPTEERKKEVKGEFFKVAGFPGVVGCIDGTHVRIQGPSEDEPAYVNRKGFHSINTQAVCDHEGRFIDVVARWPGSTHDSHIFRTSQLRERLDATHRGMQSGVLLGDSGYACKPYLVTPYLRPTSNAEERYNVAHKKTRAVIERAFGWLKRRFHVLHREIRMAPERVCTVIGACIVLHNIAILLKEPLPEDDPEEPDDGADVVCDQAEDGRRVRDFITRTYFTV